jgi:hypothetical protein
VGGRRVDGVMMLVMGCGVRMAWGMEVNRKIATDPI